MILTCSMTLSKCLFWIDFTAKYLHDLALSDTRPATLIYRVGLANVIFLSDFRTLWPSDFYQGVWVDSFSLKYAHHSTPPIFHLFLRWNLSNLKEFVFSDWHRVGKEWAVWIIKMECSLSFMPYIKIVKNKFFKNVKKV